MAKVFRLELEIDPGGLCCCQCGARLRAQKFTRFVDCEVVGPEPCMSNVSPIRVIELPNTEEAEELP